MLILVASIFEKSEFHCVFGERVLNDVVHLNMYLGACKSFRSHAITLIAETPIEVKPFKRDTSTISSSVLYKFKNFFSKYEKQISQNTP